MQFNIQAYQVQRTATTLHLKTYTPVGNGNVEVPYSLYDAQGNEVETGVKIVPLSVLEIISEEPPSIDKINAVLAGFGITAIEQKQ